MSRLLRSHQYESQGRASLQKAGAQQIGASPYPNRKAYRTVRIEDFTQKGGHR
jgi:hypothetical protein